MSKNRVKSKGSGIPKTLEWQEFKLKERVIFRLLNLCTIVIMFIMALIGFIVWYYPDVSAYGIGAIITAMVAGIFKLCHFLAKQFQLKE
jgi:hypothetical protein